MQATIKKYYDDPKLGGPSFIQMGPENVTTPTKDIIMTGETTGLYKIMNISSKEGEQTDLWILTKNLTVEERKKMEELNNDTSVK